MLRSPIRSIASINLRAALVPRAVAPAARTLAANILPSTRIINPNIGFIRAFGVSAHRLGEGLTVDQDLVHKLSEELQFEKDNDAEASTPQFITEFLQNNSFKIEDHPGVAEVTLARTFGNEKIRVAFSVDINQSEGFEDLFEEDDVDSTEEPTVDEDESDEESSFPVHATVTIEKGGKGAISINITSQDGAFMINNVLFYKDGKFATDKSSEAETKRQSLYLGPEFSQLDESLQVLLERYLEERGINTALALFIPYYSEYKEQKEYIRWLSNIKDFVEA
jgi:complement component 1 Q subcomponent-binding protein